MRGIEPKSEYDVIVIGAGVGGLTASALLSRAGMSVCVLEMDSRPGGYLAGFRRKDFRFDSAIHWLNQCGPGGMITKVFDFIGSDHPQPISQKRIKRYVGKSFDYLLTDNPELLKEQWIKDFPHEEKGIIRFFADAKNLGRSFDRASELFRSSETMSLFGKAISGLKRLRFALPFIKHISYTGEKGVRKGLNRYFKEEKLHRIFCSEPDILSCLVPIAWAYYGDYQRPPVGGSQVIPEWLLHVTKELGNDVFFRSRVTEILLNGKTCTGVKVNNDGTEHTISGQYIIAASDVKTLYEKMLPPGFVSPEILSKLENAKLYGSSVTVQLALDCTAEELGFGEEMIYLGDENLPRNVHSEGDPHLAGISVLAPSLRDKSMAPKGKGTLTIYVHGEIDHADHWKTEVNEKGERVRGEAYKKFKKEYAEILIKRVEERFSSNLSAHIEYMDIATPITHQRYTGNRDGSIMGARPGKENMQAKVAHYQTPVTNMFLGGHWAELGGGVPIAIKAGANATLLILKKHKPVIFDLLVNYFDNKDDLLTGKSNLLKEYSNNWQQQETPAQKAVNK